MIDMAGLMALAMTVVAGIIGLLVMKRSQIQTAKIAGQIRHLEKKLGAKRASEEQARSHQATMFSRPTPPSLSQEPVADTHAAKPKAVSDWAPFQDMPYMVHARPELSKGLTFTTIKASDVHIGKMPVSQDAAFPKHKSAPAEPLFGRDALPAFGAMSDESRGQAAEEELVLPLGLPRPLPESYVHH